MSSLPTGRTLDEHGDPVPGTGFEVDPDSWLADRLAERTGPITSHPTRPVWAVPLDSSNDHVNRTLSIVGPGYGGPAEHYHEQSTEAFDVCEGTVTFTCDGTDRIVQAGDETTVETGVRHTFRNDTDERALMMTEIHAPGQLNQVLPTLGGLAHDTERNPNNPLQRVAIAQRLAGNTTFTQQERPGVQSLVNALTPVARAAGYRGAYAKYLQPAFWQEHVEQPDPERF